MKYTGSRNGANDAGEWSGQPRIRGDIRTLSNNPMAPDNTYSELRRGRGFTSVVDSPNGPVRYQNPGHPWLESKNVPQLPVKRRVGRPFKGRIVTTQP